MIDENNFNLKYKLKLTRHNTLLKKHYFNPYITDIYYLQNYFFLCSSCYNFTFINRIFFNKLYLNLLTVKILFLSTLSIVTILSF